MSKDMTAYASAKPTKTMEAFADFLIAEVYGGALPKGMNEATFRAAVALAGSTRGHFQKSDFWKNDSRNYLANVDANRAAKAREAAERAVAAQTRANERAAKAVAKAEALLAAAKKAEADATDTTDADATDAEAA